jgi:hypothetical protein
MRDEAGIAGQVSLALLAAAVLFHLFALKPLEARDAQLEQRIAWHERQNLPPDARGGRAPAPAVKLAALYQALETGAQTTDLLAQLHSIGNATGVELRSADYKMHDTPARLARYEIALPVGGSYAQIRAFLERALVEIPMLSLDQVSFRRTNPKDTQVQAEVRLTLHLVKP